MAVNTELNELSRAAVDCDACFADRDVSRSFVDSAQPRYIGDRYWASDFRTAFVMLNPGAGKAEPRNVSWKKVLVEFRDGEATLQDVFAEQRSHMPFWNSGKLIDFVKWHGLDVDSIAFVNIAWCATKDNKYPSWMLRNCMGRFTGDWLRAISPNTVILSGTSAWPFAQEVRSLLPDAGIYETYHYAHRPLDAEKARARASEIRADLGNVESP
jgi:hypothetical protein